MLLRYVASKSGTKQGLRVCPEVLNGSQCTNGFGAPTIPNPSLNVCPVRCPFGRKGGGGSVEEWSPRVQRLGRTESHRYGSLLWSHRDGGEGV